ncbi:MAG: MBL fold metallo-hydrolase [bacterium]
MKKFQLSLLSCAILIAALTWTARANLRLHFIAVGHGDAILIEEDGRGMALVDAGLPQAGGIVLDYLRTQSIHRLEHLFVTHTHDDHVGGVPLILDSLEVGVIHHTGMVDNHERAALFTRYLQRGNWQVDTVNVGDVPVEDDRLRLEVLSPERSQVAGRRADPNPNSLVLLLTYGAVKVLLAADIDSEREQWLIEKYGSKLKCQVLKAAHHASDNGNCLKFLQTVQPQVMVVCVGPSQWGYPSPQTMERLRANCPEVFRTDEVGTVVLESDGKRVVVVQPEGE